MKRDGLPKFSRKGKKLIKENLINKYDQILSDRLSQILRIQIRLSDNTFYEPLSEHAAKSVYRKIVESAANHLSDVGFKSVVVPASGGADSTFVLKILMHPSVSLTQKWYFCVKYTEGCIRFIKKRESPVSTHSRVHTTLFASGGLRSSK